MIDRIIVADESVDFRVIAHLRELGYDIYAIMEQARSISDIEVLKIAVEKKALLITEDKDFGELVFRLQLPHTGVLLLRLVSLPIDERLRKISDALQFYPQLVNVFSVLSNNTIRIKQL